MPNTLLGINIVAASAITNDREKMKELKKKVKMLSWKNIINKITLTNKLNTIVKIVEVLFMLNAVIITDLQDKYNNCFIIE